MFVVLSHGGKRITTGWELILFLTTPSQAASRTQFADAKRLFVLVEAADACWVVLTAASRWFWRASWSAVRRCSACRRAASGPTPPAQSAGTPSELPPCNEAQGLQLGTRMFFTGCPPRQHVMRRGAAASVVLIACSKAWDTHAHGRWQYQHRPYRKPPSCI